MSTFCVLVMMYAEEEREVLHIMLETHQEKQKALGLLVLRDDIIEISADQVFQDLLQEGISKGQAAGIVMEVGMHRATQCINAAKVGYEVHCVEPSPNSFQRVEQDVAKSSTDLQQKIHLYQVAAGSTSEEMVPFLVSAQGKGVQEEGHDLWAMAEQQLHNDTSLQVIQVPTMRLDDIVLPNLQAYILKVDTHGFEPTVFSGLTESLEQHKIQYVLTEFWPRGIDLSAGKPDECIGVEMLEDFLIYNYTLYALPVMADSAAPRGWQSLAAYRPLYDLQEYCEWYFQLEYAFPSTHYRMGYWSNILAVAPGATLPSPQTKTGKALAEANL
jgi:FkbM family methyltransferase